MSADKEVVLRTVVMQDDEEEELLAGVAPSTRSATTSAITPAPGAFALHSAHEKANSDSEGEDEFALDIACVPRSERTKDKDSTGFFSSSNVRSAVSSSAAHHKPSSVTHNDGTVALDAYPSGFPDDTDRPNDREEWARWQVRQKARSQLPQFALLQSAEN